MKTLLNYFMLFLLTATVTNNLTGQNFTVSSSAVFYDVENLFDGNSRTLMGVPDPGEEGYGFIAWAEITTNNINYINTITIEFMDLIGLDLGIYVMVEGTYKYIGNIDNNWTSNIVTFVVNEHTNKIKIGADLSEAGYYLGLSELSVSGEWIEPEAPTQFPRVGIGGTYSSYQVQGIWSISPNYKINAIDNDFGNQYGLCYAHTNAGTGTKKALYGFGHQIAYTNNGTANAVISLSNGYAYFKSVGIGINPYSNGGVNPKLTISVPLETPPNDVFRPSQGFQIVSVGNGALELGIMTGANSTHPSWLQTSFKSSKGIYNPFLLNPSGGNVGIGTTNPQATLHVNGGLQVNGDVRGGFRHGTLRIRTDDGTVDIGAIGNYALIETDREDFFFNKPVMVTDELRAYTDLHISTGETKRMTILDSNGNVGIGTSNPKSKLEVAGWIGRTAHENGGLVGSYNNVGGNDSKSNPIYIIGSNYKPGSTSLSNMYGVGYTHTNASFISTPTNKGWGFYVASDGDARIFLNASSNGDSYFNAGNIGIGTTTPEYKLHVVGNTHIAGDLTLDGAGKVGIGTETPEYNLDVVGKIRAHEIKVSTDKTADFVFEADYNLRNLKELEQFIVENKHLPEVAPASQMEEEGLDVADFNILLLQKIEELTLYVIELKNENERQEDLINDLLSK